MDLSSLMGGGGGGGGIEVKSQATSTANACDYSSGGAGTLPKGAAFGMAIDELYSFAKAYALIALDICNRPRT